jgi:hypothetical protein
LIAYFRSNPNGEVELGVLREIAKHQPALALERLQELSAAKLSNGIASAADDLLIELAKKSPSSLQAALDTLSPELRTMAESALSGERLATSFATEMNALSEHPEGLRILKENLSKRPELSTQLLKHLGRIPDEWKQLIAKNWGSSAFHDGKKWFEADLGSAGFSPSQAKAIKGKALQSLASKDPEFALANLSAADESSKDYILASIFSREGDEARTEKLISLLTSEEDRKRAGHLLLQESLSNKANPTKPGEWLTQLSQLDERKGLPYAALANLQKWDTAIGGGQRRLQANARRAEAAHRAHDRLKHLVIRHAIGLLRERPSFFGEPSARRLGNPPGRSRDGELGLRCPARCSQSFRGHFLGGKPTRGPSQTLGSKECRRQLATIRPGGSPSVDQNATSRHPGGNHTAPPSRSVIRRARAIGIVPFRVSSTAIRHISRCATFRPSAAVISAPARNAWIERNSQNSTTNNVSAAPETEPQMPWRR